MVEEDDRPKQLSRSARAPRLVSDNQQTAHMPSGTINTHHSRSEEWATTERGKDTRTTQTPNPSPS